MKLKMNKATRGGPRTEKRLTKGQARLLQAIWEAKGGVFAVGRLLGIHVQTPVNWKLRGKVPLESVGPVSRKLEVSKYALNFEDMVSLNGEGPAWLETVQSVGLEPEVQSWVLKGKAPKSVAA